MMVMIYYDNLNKSSKNFLTKKYVPNFRQILEKSLLTKYSPPSLLIDREGTILYVQGQVNRFIEVQSGDVNMNIFQMVKEDFQDKDRSYQD